VKPLGEFDVINLAIVIRIAAGQHKVDFLSIFNYKLNVLRPLKEIISSTYGE